MGIVAHNKNFLPRSLRIRYTRFPEGSHRPVLIKFLFRAATTPSLGLGAAMTFVGADR
jgi:hypothetical protein